MKRHALQLSLIAALLAAPAAWAGSEIVKCVDREGHVTLTDQPCEQAATTVRLPDGAAAEAGEAPVATPAVQHFPAPRALPRNVQWKQPEAKRVKLARDVATLKEARAQLLLLDAGSRSWRG